LQKEKENMMDGETFFSIYMCLQQFTHSVFVVLGRSESYQWCLHVIVQQRCAYYMKIFRAVIEAEKVNEFRVVVKQGM
jgi:hypothetical protein